MYNGKMADPNFREGRARAAGKASQSPEGKISRFVRSLERGEFSPDQIETVRKAIDKASDQKG